MGNYAQQLDKMLELAKVTHRMGRIYRAVRFDDGAQESDAEHSFMLGLVATELASAYYTQLDIALIGELARVHDLIELHLDDMPTFIASEKELADKKAAEGVALTVVLSELPPYTASLLVQYEAQSDPEARFVRYVDKLLPDFVNIIGKSTYRQMKEVYGITTKSMLKNALAERRQKFNSLAREFPIINEIHIELYSQLEAAWDEELTL